MKKTSYFWVGFSDLMTSLFFIMLILFAITFIKLKNSDNNADRIKDLEKEVASLNKDKERLLVNEEKFEEINNVEKALSNLNPEYFSFDHNNKRYRLNIDVIFESDSSNINYIGIKERQQLLKAGNELYSKISNLIKDKGEIEYLLIIEGNTQRNEKYKNYERNPDRGYRLSYERALALNNFWKANGIDFRKLEPNCEIILAGSGYFGQSRDEKNPDNNRRFTIQVTSKVGKFLQNK